MCVCQRMGVRVCVIRGSAESYWCIMHAAYCTTLAATHDFVAFSFTPAEWVRSSTRCCPSPPVGDHPPRRHRPPVTCDPENRLLVSKSSLTWTPESPQLNRGLRSIARVPNGFRSSVVGVLGSPLASNQASLHFKQLRPSTRAGYPSNHLGPGALHSACRIVSPLVIALVRNKVKHPRPSRTDSAAAREW